ncbi:MAG TPA: aldehyde dehydrogenase family protein [Mycobacteriales bacterium]|nr:aldehyde dehydrogenase family protein [Mycobacteriales bacterium]
MTTARPDPVSYQLFVGGDWVAPVAGGRSERTSPADGRPVGSYGRGTAADVDAAVAAARRAFDDSPWATGPARERAAIMRRAAGLLRDRAERIGLRISLELGKPIRLARGEVQLTADVLDYYAALATDLRGEAISAHTPDALGLILHEPVGVVAMITPWNFPLLGLAWKVAPALAAGCTMVTKPASLTPSPALELAGVLADAGLPAGVYNVVTGGGSEVGTALAAHPGVDKVAFTGSNQVGRQVLTAAAGTMKKVSLELGGKSPNVVFADARIDQAVSAAYWGIFLNTGQACQAGSRLLVAREIHDEFVEALVTMARTSRIGDPLDEKTMIGPVVDPGQLDTVLRYVESGTEQGAELLTGGHRMTEGALGSGCYVEPTVFDRVTPAMTVGREEIFGPVLSVLTFDDPAEAVRLANDTMFGLAAAVWTRDVDTALRTAKAIRAGTVWINAYHDAGLAFVMPFGGYKTSGFGRELGREGLQEYFETKAIHVRLGRLDSP